MNAEQPASGALQLPDSLQPLEQLAYNLYWSWIPAARELFADLDGAAWDASAHNPVRLLQSIDGERLSAAAGDPAYVARVGRVTGELDAVLANKQTWFTRVAGTSAKPTIAYFSAEFGVSESLPLYAGGLGVLAGDHLKAASDLGISLVAIGLFYHYGYFRQSLDDVGWQQDSDLGNDPAALPVTLARTAGGRPITITVEFPGREVKARIWQARVGRIPLYLLDTKVLDNRPDDQALCDRLYGGDLETRIGQEVLLGIGGYRALEALGIDPQVFHMNEGHSAFLALERTRRLMASRGISFAEASDLTSAGTVFTTHTPVAAGHDYFPSALMRSYFRSFARELGLEWQEFMGLGRDDPHDQQAAFGMTTLAIRMSSARNGVSKLHGEVTRRMWAHLWPATPETDVPIDHVTNGVHLPTWVSGEFRGLFEQYLGARWREAATTPEDWAGIEEIQDDTLWMAHQHQKERLVAVARERLANQLSHHGVSAEEQDQASAVLDPDALTIGFARRFTAYKRATLLLTDVERLARILNNADRPVQVVFAGKAHPRDDPGKLLIQRIASVASRPQFQGRLLFLEDYDMALARRLVQGVDVWLNNPIRPQEASGTSGMKAAANGVLNLSTLDGWWDEAWHATRDDDRPIGWIIETGVSEDDQAARDRAEAAELYDVLEREVIPTFYERDARGLPQAWIESMKAAIRCAGPGFGANRMVAEYTERFYLPAAARIRESSGQ